MLPQTIKRYINPIKKRQNRQRSFGRRDKRKSLDSNGAFEGLVQTVSLRVGNMPTPYLPSSCCRLSCSLRRAWRLAMRAGLSGSGTAVGMGSST